MSDLTALGLSSYEECAYMALLDLGSAPAPEIANEAELPEGRIYDTLNELERRGLVEKDANQRPQLYRPVEPEIAIDRLLETQKQELEAERSRIERAASELRKDLGQFSPTDGRFWLTRTEASEAEFVENQIERFSEASNEVLIVGDLVLIEQFSKANEELRNWLNEPETEAPSVRILLSRETEQDRLREALGGSLADRIEIRNHPSVTANFDLIDQDELYLYLTDPFARSQPMGTIRISDEEVIKELRQEFTEYWEQADLAFPN